MSNLSVIHSLDIKKAPLPAVYENATLAISNCVEVDECKDWANKAEALASYARQAADDDLEQMCKRIRARAIRKCGELLKQFDGKGNNQHSNGSDTKLSKTDVAESAGLSKRQQVTANRLANIPENDFERQVEQAQVPTITELSEQGKQARDYLAKPKPDGFAEAIHFTGYLEEIIHYKKRYSAEFLFNGMDESERQGTMQLMNELKEWFDEFQGLL